MSQRTLIHHQVEDVETRLASLGGLSVDLLLEAVAVGEAARNSCTDNDAPTGPGFMAWLRTLRGLRELTAVLGWRRDDSRGLNTAVSPDGKIAIAVANGDELTGCLSGWPTTKNGKGRCAEVAAHQNQMVLPFLEFETMFEDTATGLQTWYLLIASDEDEVCCELSLPIAIGSTGKVTAWRERVLLPALARDRVAVVVPADREPDIVVEISRRAQSR